MRGAGKGGTVEKLQETIEDIKTDLGKPMRRADRAPQPVIVAADTGVGLSRHSRGSVRSWDRWAPRASWWRW